MNSSSIEIYKLEDGNTEISVMLDGETVWLSLNQLADLFQRDKSVISRHINNIFKEGELNRRSTVANFATVQIEGEREITRSIEYYNLDVIISVGYRVKSQRGTDFRIWANQILKDYLIRGYSINEKRLIQQNEQLKELQKSVKILGEVLNQKIQSYSESAGLLRIISDYAYALDVLDQYDYQSLRIQDTSGKETYQLQYDEAIQQIQFVRQKYGNSELFAVNNLQIYKESSIFVKCCPSKRFSSI